MKRWFRIAGMGIGLAATVAFGLYAAQTMHGQDLSRFASTEALTGIGIAAVLYTFIIPFSALAWKRLLLDTGARRDLRELAVILSVTQLGKYLPGNVGHHLGRGAMSLSKGIKLEQFFSSVSAETVVVILAGVFVGLAGAAFSSTGLHVLNQESITAIAITGTLAGCAIVALLLAPKLLPVVAKRIAKGAKVATAISRFPKPPSLTLAFFAYCLNYIVVGLGMTVMTMMILPDAKPDLPLFACSFAVAWIVGFLAPGAPAGFGIREGAMLAMLGPAYAEPDALVIIIAIRLATTVGDGLCFLGGSALALTLRAESQSTGKENTGTETNDA